MATKFVFLNDCCEMAAVTRMQYATGLWAAAKPGTERCRRTQWKRKRG